MKGNHTTNKIFTTYKACIVQAFWTSPPALGIRDVQAKKLEPGSIFLFRAHGHTGTPHNFYDYAPLNYLAQ